MIILGIIGIILNLLVIWFLNNSITAPAKWESVTTQFSKPVLRVWVLIALIVVNIIPILNIFAAVIAFIVWAIKVYGYKDWEFIQEDSKLMIFLNRRIKL